MVKIVRILKKVKVYLKEGFLRIPLRSGLIISEKEGTSLLDKSDQVVEKMVRQIGRSKIMKKKIDFRDLAIKKYLEKYHMDKVPRPDIDQGKYGKRSELDYIKDIAYFNQELHMLGGDDIRQKSKSRLRKKILEEKEFELKMNGPMESSEELYIEKSQDSFEQRRHAIRELMCKRKENHVQPDFLRESDEEEVYNEKNPGYNDKEFQKTMMKKGYIYLPSKERIKFKEKQKEKKYQESTINSTQKSGVKEVEQKDSQTVSLQSNKIPDKGTDIDPIKETRKKASMPFWKYKKEVLERKKTDKKLKKMKKKEQTKVKNRSERTIPGKNSHQFSKKKDVERIEIGQSSKINKRNDSQKINVGVHNNETINTDQVFSHHNLQMLSMSQKKKPNKDSVDSISINQLLKDSKPDPSKVPAHRFSQSNSKERKKIQILAKSKAKKADIQNINIPSTKRIPNTEKMPANKETRLQVPNIKVARLSDCSPKANSPNPKDFNSHSNYVPKPRKHDLSNSSGDSSY
ncbi:unnamed protein product [Moneuplotes crassus]|uniref:Uncharacterized protein n=1 Tax=Euplotes crassus TaxID=5936 RepID=A0AAD1U1D7_EUPCR|nr:unnamed protein product [Moneuplotes crassus]